MVQATITVEAVVAEESFTQSLFLPFKTTLRVSNKRLAGESRNLFLGLLPTGTNHVTYPLGSIASVESTTDVSVGTLLFGVFLFLALFTFRPGGILLGLMGIALIFSAFEAAISVTNNAGQKTALPILFTERQKALAFVRQVNDVLAHHI